MSTAQLLVTLALLGLLVLIHLMGGPAHGRKQGPFSDADPWTRILLLAALGAVAFAIGAFAIPQLRDDEDEVAETDTTSTITTTEPEPTTTTEPTTTSVPTTTSTTTTTQPPPPPQPQLPPSSALLARLTVQESGNISVATYPSRLKGRASVRRLGTGRYEVRLGGVPASLKRTATLRATTTRGGSATVGRDPAGLADFLVVTTADGDLADEPFALAAYVPRRELQAAIRQREKPLPDTR